MLKSITLLFFSFSAFATEYYVAVDGDDMASGLNQNNAWKTLSYSTTQVVAGDTVYIKAGDYGNENVVMTIDGTTDLPIIFSGYQLSPGDDPDLEYTFGDSLDPTIMPLLDGGNRASGGTGMALHSRQFITIKNIQIQNYEIGIYAWHGNHLTIDNIITSTFGDVNASYSGNGIVFGSDANNNTIKNCVVVNAAAENLSIVGDNNTIDNCQVFCNDNQTEHSSTDYYIHVSGNNNIIRNSSAERIGNLEHGGHGIGFKGDAENNVVENCTSKNLAGGFYVRHRGAKNNIFRHCLSINDEFGLLLRDGANNNTFANCEIRNATQAIAFMDTDEDDGAQYAARFNTIKNCLITDTQQAVISFHYYSLDSDASNNVIENCTISNSPLLFNSQRNNFSNTLINSIVTGVDNYETGDFPVNFTFSYTNFHNNGFAMQTGLGNLNINPLFLSTNDYHLTLDSPLIDMGDPNYTGELDDVDMDGEFRIINSAIDIGVDEFNDVIFLSGFG